TVMTKVQFESIDPRVLPEMSAKVAFLSREVTPADQQSIVAVNADAIAKRNDRSVLYAVRNDRAVEVPVQTGAKIGDLIAVTGDIKPGERVVLKPGSDVVDGALVKAASK